MKIIPSNKERFLNNDDIIVSKTDVRGKITYANDIFLNISLYSESEVIGSPHSLVRHPDMPRCIFGLLWENIQEGRELFAYVKNMSKNGDHYWVIAHVTPTFGAAGEIIGYHSMRRSPDRGAVERVEQLYRELVDEERRFPNPKAATQAGGAMLQQRLAAAGCPYEEFVHGLAR